MNELVRSFAATLLSAASLDVAPGADFEEGDRVEKVTSSAEPSP